MRGCIFGLALLGAGCAGSARTRLEPQREALPGKAVLEAPIEVTKVVPGRVAFVLETHATANLLYQLDCLAERMPCSRSSYGALWQQLGWSPEDAAAVTEWGRLRERFAGELRSTDQPPVPAPLTLSAGRRELGDRQRWAGFEARSLEDYGRLVDLVVDVGDGPRLESIARRVEPRFTAWWQREAGPALAPFVGASAALTALHLGQRIVEAAVRFYGADVPTGLRVPIHFFYRPALGEPSTHGEMVEAHAAVEVLEGEHAEDRLAVVLHELFHVFYARMPLTRRAAVVNAFAARSEPHALAAEALLNEVLATAIGNGLLDAVLRPAESARRRAKPLGLYGDPAIDEAARALLRDGFERALVESSIVDPTFVTSYVQDAASAFPGGLRPLDTLRAFSVASNSTFRAARRALQTLSNTHDSSSFTPIDGEVASMLRDNPRQPLVLFVTPKELDRLLGLVPKATHRRIVAAAKQQASFVDATSRGPGSYTYVFVAPDPTAADQLVQRFAAQKSLFEGLLR